jgi:predicted metal-dependent hydrolase
MIMTDGRLAVRAQSSYSLEHIQQIVNKDSQRILTAQKRVKADHPQILPRKYISGENFLYLGKLYRLSVVSNDHKRLCFDGKQFILDEHCRQKSADLFRKWYKREALKIIRERANYYSLLLKLEYTKIRITSARHRWGSCNEKKNLFFPLYLVMAPVPVIDSVVIHELFHTIEMGHSPEFRKIVRTVSPHYDEHMNWLKKYQNLFKL